MSTFRKVFRENMGIKVAAIVLSFLVYFHVRTEGEGEMAFRIPVDLQGIPDSLTWMGQAPSEVTVTFSGRLKNLIKLRLAALRIPVDLAQAGPGRFQRTLSAGDVPIPEGSNVAVSHFAGPERIDILIEKKLSRTVPVAPLLTGQLPRGFALTAAPVASPESVLVSGPTSVVSSLDSLYTEPIDVSGRKQSFSVKVRLDSAGKTFSCVSETVEVFIAVAAESLHVSEGVRRRR